MSNHNHSGESNRYQPDQPYYLVDDITGAIAEAILHGYTGSSEALASEFAWLARMTKLLIKDPPTPESPPELPPKLLQLWAEEDRRNSTLPPETPQ